MSSSEENCGFSAVYDSYYEFWKSVFLWRKIVVFCNSLLSVKVFLWRKSWIFYNLQLPEADFFLRKKSKSLSCIWLVSQCVSEENHGFSEENCGFSVNEGFKKKMSFSEENRGFSVRNFIASIFCWRNLWIFGIKLCLWSLSCIWLLEVNVFCKWML